MQTRSSDEKAVCLSNAWIVTKRKNDLSRFLYHTKEEWLVGANPFYLKFWVNWPPLERNRRFSADICSYRLSRNT